MEKKVFEHLGETLYHEQLANGLNVYLLPKPGFNKSYATFTTKYGSIDNEFVPLGKDEMTHVPDGIAHFLEHKLFEKEEYDVFEKFSLHSASSNAFTSFTRTCYLFSCTSDLSQNLTTLIDFVQSPYFTEKTVEKEKGIIAQEIKMYDDNPDFKAYYGVINNLYHHHPVKIDIAGTVESIQPITAELLYQCYETFYHPSNMIMFVVGDFDVTDVMGLIRDNQSAKTYQKEDPIARHYPDEPNSVVTKQRTEYMEIQTPKVLIGIKDCHMPLKGYDLLKYELAVEIIYDLLFGSSSAYYEEMLEKGYINDSFTYEASFDSSYGFSLIGGDTKFPNELAESVKEKLATVKSLEISEDDFMRVKNKKVGRFLSALNSMEVIANQFTEYAFNEIELFSINDYLQQLTLDELKKYAAMHFNEELMSVYMLLPKQS